jgi:hypothetical protein
MTNPKDIEKAMIEIGPENQAGHTPVLPRPPRDQAPLPEPEPKKK